jgi:hypothetical protein
MKTRGAGVTLLLMVGLFTGLDALAFYNPSTGRWLSRDPIAEHGGVNLYALVANNPINGFDRFGLIGDPGPDPFLANFKRSCKACRCRRVTVPIDPNQRPQAFPGSTPGTVLAGYPVPVSVEVDGDISKCKCKHQDIGTVTVGWPTPVTLNMTSEREIPCSYSMDAPGYDNNPSPAPGSSSDQFRFTYNLTIAITCTDSDGENPITGSGTLPPGPFWFRIETSPDGKTTTVPTPPAQ